jgi:hypothetical protein
VPEFNSAKRPLAALAIVLVCGVILAPPAARGLDVEGVQPAALDQPRINLCLRRDPKGPPLAAKGDAAGALAALLGGGKGKDAGDAKVINIRAFLDTGASGVMISKPTADALGIKPAAAGSSRVTFHDVGVGGTQAFGVSEPLHVALAPTNGGDEPADPSQYAQPFGPVRVQLSTANGLMDKLTGGLDVIGMPAMKGRVVVLDPRPVDSMADTMHAVVLDALRNRAEIPKVDRTVALSYASFARFTRTEPAEAQGPTLADNPFVGPSPVAGKGAKPQAAAAGAIPPIVITLNGKRSSGSWLLDTGAAASMISEAQARALGITYADDGHAKLLGVPENEQFSLDIGGVGGQKKAAGFFLDTLTLPTRERDPIVYKHAPVLVMDITVEDPKTKEQITLDGVLGMNYFVASANVKGAGGLLPDINNLTAGPYALIVFDEPGATLGLKVKPEFLKAEAKGSR